MELYPEDGKVENVHIHAHAQERFGHMAIYVHTKLDHDETRQLMGKLRETVIKFFEPES